MENRLCRLCLTPNAGRIPLFDEMTMKPNVLLIQKVVECTSIGITAEDDYPSSVCVECERKLNELSAFKIQCIVNNDYYREQQAELRKKQLSCSQQPTEVVCLDDDDEDEIYYEQQQQQKQQELQDLPKAPNPKIARIEQVVIEDDDEDDGDDGGPLNYESEQNDYEEFNLDDFELVEGQEVDQYYQPEEQPLDSNAILTSILLDDEEDNDSGNNALLIEQGHYEKVYPYECEFCRRRYSSLTKLESHVKSHSQNRMKCFICGKMVVVHLLRHLRSQHPGMTFPEPVRCWHSKCADLDQVFLDVNQLLAHMDTKRRRR